MKSNEHLTRVELILRIIVYITIICTFLYGVGYAIGKSMATMAK